MKFYILHIMLVFCVCTSVFSQKADTDIQLLNPQKKYTAGDNIVLAFKTQKEPCQLYVTHSYGTTLLNPIVNSNHTILYSFPTFITEKKGWVSWNFINDFKTTKGQFYIHPTNSVSKIETYLGPPTIEAGIEDYAMLVTMPLDNFDNPLEQGTPVSLNRNFLNQQTQKQLLFNGMIAFDIERTTSKSGRLFLGVACKNTTSKELTLDVYPSKPTDFKIKANTVHSYADGNQLVTFTTSVLKDTYNNMVSDGTLVNFSIQNDHENYFETYGTTINGIATAQLPHPNNAQTWNAQATVTNMAKSNKIHLVFKSAVRDFSVNYNLIKKEINVGPLKSFMNQLIPDGLPVIISIYKNNNIVKTLKTQTEHGFANIAISNYITTSQKYSVTITAANITKEITIYD